MLYLNDDEWQDLLSLYAKTHAGVECRRSANPDAFWRYCQAGLMRRTSTEKDRMGLYTFRFTYFGHRMCEPAHAARHAKRRR